MRQRIIEILGRVHPEIDFKKTEYSGEYLDSFEVVLFVSQIEKEFNVVIDGTLIRKENFDSIDNIIRLINESEVRK